MEFNRRRRETWGRHPFGSSVTWSAINKATLAALSTDKLTASIATDGTNFSGRSDTSIASGAKRHWEAIVVNDSGANCGVGIVNASETFEAGEWIGHQANGVALYSDGKLYKNAVSLIDLGLPFTSGARLCFEVDDGGKLLWIRIGAAGDWNGSGTANPATGAGGVDISDLGAVFPAYNVFSTAGVSGTVLLVPGPTFGTTPSAGFTGF